MVDVATTIYIYIHTHLALFLRYSSLSFNKSCTFVYCRYEQRENAFLINKKAKRKFIQIPRNWRGGGWFNI
jgi:hypothetical protein